MKFKNQDKNLLILDLDETLIHARKTPLRRPADFMLFDYHVYCRPHLTAFIEQVKQYFLLAVWSSASDDYVEEMVKRILPAEVELEFAWGRSRCTYRRNYRLDDHGHYSDYYSSHYHYVKPLKKVKKRGYNIDRILIVDDSPHKVAQNYGNAVYPRAYLGQEEDQELKLLAKYLVKLRDLDSVLSIEKRGWRREV